MQDRGRTISRLGAGVRTFNHELLPNSVLDESTRLKTITSTPKVTVWEQAVKNEKDFHHQLGVTSSASVGAEISSISLNFTEKMEFAKSVNFDNQSVYITVRKLVERTETYDGNLVMRDEVAKQLKAEGSLINFYMQYGDKFISHATWGSEAIAVIQLSSDSQLTTTDNNAMVGAKVSVPQAGALKVAGNVGVHKGEEDYGSKSAGGCWIYIAGVSDKRSFVPDTQDLSSLLISIHSLFEFGPDGAALEVPLSYQLLPYSRLLQSQNNLALTGIFVNFEVDHLLLIKRFYVEARDLLKLAEFYSNKYEATWTKMNEESMKYKSTEESKGQFVDFWKRRDEIKALVSQLEKLSHELIVLKPLEHSRHDTSEVEKVLDSKLQKYKKNLQALIESYADIVNYIFLMRVHHPARELRTKPFSLNYSGNAKYLFWKTSDPKHKQIEFEVKHGVVHEQHGVIFDLMERFKSASYTPVNDHHLKGSGDYLDSALIPRNAPITIEPVGQPAQNEDFSVDIFEVDGEIEHEAEKNVRVASMRPMK